MMKPLVDIIGSSSFIVGMMLSIVKWISGIDYDVGIDLLTLVSLTIGIVYVLVCTYHQWLKIKETKGKNRKND